MVIKKPMIKLVGEEKTPVVQRFEERYMEDDLVLDYIYENNSANTDEDDDATESVSASSDMSWLDQLK
jgi:hypothetical protein